MKCANCGASLPGKSDICKYCGALNDTDLRAVHFFTKNGPDSERRCPRCDKALKTINIGSGDKFYIERCIVCLGIFFDPGELEHIMDSTVANVADIDHHKLDTLLDERQKNTHPTAYIKCPICQKLMNRKNYGTRSGVVADTCKEHGVWLDGGELGTLFRWAKAGGQIHNKVMEVEKERLKMQLKRAAQSPDSRDLQSFRSEAEALSLLSLLIKK